VVVKVAGSGLCHTDFTVISRIDSKQKGPFFITHQFQDSLAAKCSPIAVPANFSLSRRAKYTTVVRGR